MSPPYLAPSDRMNRLTPNNTVDPNYCAVLTLPWLCISLVSTVLVFVLFIGKGVAYQFIGFILLLVTLVSLFMTCKMCKTRRRIRSTSLMDSVESAGTVVTNTQRLAIWEPPPPYYLCVPHLKLPSYTEVILASPCENTEENGSLGGAYRSYSFVLLFAIVLLPTLAFYLYPHCQRPPRRRLRQLSIPRESITSVEEPFILGQRNLVSPSSVV